MKKNIKISNELRILLEESFTLQIKRSYFEMELDNILRKIKDYQYKSMLPNFVVEYTFEGKIKNIYNIDELTDEERQEIIKQQNKIHEDAIRKERVNEIAILPTK